MTERYEALRSGGSAQGRALLMSRGITVCIQTWSQLATADQDRTRLSSDTGPNGIERRMSERIVPDNAQPELVRVLAAMAWAVARG